MDAFEQSYLVPMDVEEVGLLVENVWNQEVRALVSMAYHYCEQSEY
jgi:hypothetical protein